MKMDALIKAAEQALEALEDIFGKNKVDVGAITALRAALAEHEQEPVAWMVYTLDGKSVCVTDNPADFGEQHRALPLYTHPPRREWQGLTDEEINRVEDQCWSHNGLGATFFRSDFARAIEAKLKERNHG